MANTYTLIASNTLTSSAASVTFSSIPATYTDLVLKWSIRTNRSATADTIKLILNSDTATNYSQTTIQGLGTATQSVQYTLLDYSHLGAGNADTTTSNTFSNGELYLPNYTGTNKKAYSSINAQETNATAAQIWGNAHLWQGTAAVTGMTLSPNVGPNFVSGSSFFLYGIKNS